MNANSITQARKARARMLSSRKKADADAQLYREKVRAAVDELVKTGVSQRQIAAQLLITEGSLRALLRPQGEARRRRD